jgi:hypothetical protein
MPAVDQVAGFHLNWRLHLDTVGLVSLHALSLDYRANRFHEAVLTAMLWLCHEFADRRITNVTRQ